MSAPRPDTLARLIRAAFDNDGIRDEAPNIAQRIEELASECHCPDCRELGHTEGVTLFGKIGEELGTEVNHIYADLLLLALIGDDDVARAFLALDRWYS